MSVPSQRTEPSSEDLHTSHNKADQIRKDQREKEARHFGGKGPIISRHMTVMHLVWDSKESERSLVEFASDMDEYSRDEFNEHFFMTHQYWSDMGRPQTITLGVVAGDQLNNPNSDSQGS